jgi:hypothetical protein
MNATRIITTMTILLILFILLSPFTSTASRNAPEFNRIKTIKSLKKLDDFQGGPPLHYFITDRSGSNGLSLLKDVSQGNTIWSVVYDTSSLDFLVVMGKKYDHVHKFNLNE